MLYPPINKNTKSTAGTVVYRMCRVMRKVFVCSCVCVSHWVILSLPVLESVRGAEQKAIYSCERQNKATPIVFACL